MSPSSSSSSESSSMLITSFSSLSFSSSSLTSSASPYPPSSLPSTGSSVSMISGVMLSGSRDCALLKGPDAEAAADEGLLGDDLLGRCISTRAPACWYVCEGVEDGGGRVGSWTAAVALEAARPPAISDTLVVGPVCWRCGELYSLPSSTRRRLRLGPESSSVRSTGAALLAAVHADAFVCVCCCVGAGDSLPVSFLRGGRPMRSRSAWISALVRRSRSLTPNFLRIMLCLVPNVFRRLSSLTRLCSGSAMASASRNLPEYCSSAWRSSAFRTAICSWVRWP
ncbi:hypothetical protein CONLIGDRAFT_236863 [Coniochaeta ligniaria NRRL 30616]|uniref:Uncharacterized protein n=1 Tax=Coniochaeta ligniaria NRRL 30616 TaxID=1408157 RepID=A0A1J7IWY9_9PEZI|nr:hypothetical protein CONLIGDRAFT_236863 [Coniochaeta ligniaria NRRL 30616]